MGSFNVEKTFSYNLVMVPASRHTGLLELCPKLMGYEGLPDTLVSPISELDALHFPTVLMGVL